MFIDQAQLELQAGKGGAGSISFRREKFIPKGGPDGGNGGRGGNIVLIGDSNLRTLQDYRYKKKYIASNGYPGSSNSKSGKNGNDIKIRIPLGTIVKNLKSSEVVVDILHNEQSFVVCNGGKGGKGNINFKSSPYFEINFIFFLFEYILSKILLSKFTLDHFLDQLPHAQEFGLLVKKTENFVKFKSKIFFGKL